MITINNQNHLQPTMGMGLSAAIRLQINLDLRKVLMLMMTMTTMMTMGTREVEMNIRSKGARSSTFLFPATGSPSAPDYLVTCDDDLDGDDAVGDGYDGEDLCWRECVAFLSPPFSLRFENSIDSPPESLMTILRDALHRPSSMARGATMACLAIIILQVI